MEPAPAWLLDKAISSEMNTNWAHAYEKVKESEVPQGANVIGSHIIYKLKLEKHGKRLKSLLCLHENRDKEKDGIRKDSSTAQFYIIRLIASMVASLIYQSLR